jgi:hypothetical protein
VPSLSDWGWSEADKENALEILRRKRHVIALPKDSSAVILKALDDVIDGVERSLPRPKGKGQARKRWRVRNPLDLVL